MGLFIGNPSLYKLIHAVSKIRIEAFQTTVLNFSTSQLARTIESREHQSLKLLKKQKY